MVERDFKRNHCATRKYKPIGTVFVVLQSADMQA